MMFSKKFNDNNKDMTLGELVKEYAKDYFVNVEYLPNGSVQVFIGSKKDEEGSKDETD